MTTADERKQDNSRHGLSESNLASDRLTRKGVADILGVSIFKVRSMEGRELHPKVLNGVHYFDAEDVATVARAMAQRRRHGGERTDGEIAALAFLAFDESKDLIQIVTELCMRPTAHPSPAE
jgi:hypothetical protein